LEVGREEFNEQEDGAEPIELGGEIHEGATAVEASNARVPIEEPVQFNSIQHNDYIVILCATKAFKSPLFRSRNDRCRTIRGVKTFPERDLKGAEQERARGEARLRFGDGVQEVL
jgi:hypothetical protein